MTDKERLKLEMEKSLANESLVIAALVAIRKKYVEILKAIMGDMSKMYMILEKEGSLSYADAKRHRDLDRFQRRVMVRATELGSSNKQIMDKLLDDSYQLSYSHMSYAIEKETGLMLKNATPHLPEILDKVNKNPIKGLKLTAAQERDRKLIVKGINGAISDGLKAGETYGGIARKIQKEFDSSYKRAVKIAHTETHRVRELANLEAAINSTQQGIIMQGTWRNMADERVRPNRGIGKAANGSAGAANHVNMEGQKRIAGETFDLIPNGKTKAPGSSGIAQQDINCRCYISWKVLRLEGKAPKEAAKNTEKNFKEWEKNKTA